MHLYERPISQNLLWPALNNKNKEQTAYHFISLRQSQKELE